MNQFFLCPQTTSLWISLENFVGPYLCNWIGFTKLIRILSAKEWRIWVLGEHCHQQFGRQVTRIGGTFNSIWIHWMYFQLSFAMAAFTYMYYTLQASMMHLNHYIVGLVVDNHWKLSPLKSYNKVLNFRKISVAKLFQRKSVFNSCAICQEFDSVVKYTGKWFLDSLNHDISSVLNLTKPSMVMVRNVQWGNHCIGWKIDHHWSLATL